MSATNENKVGNTPLMVLAIPIFIEMVMAYMIPMVDIYFLSMVSDSSVAAVSSVMPLLLIGVSLLGAFQVAGVSVCSKLIGSQEFEELSRVHVYLVVLMVGLGAVLSLVYYTSAGYITELLGIDATLAVGASEYYKMWGGGMFLFALYLCFCTLLIVQGRTIYIIISGALMNIINIFLDYVLIAGNLGAEPLGPRGAATAGVVAWLFADIVIILSAIYLVKIRFVIDTNVSVMKRCLTPMLRIAIPGSIEPLSYQAAQAAIVVILVSINDLSLVARGYVLNFVYLTNIWNIAMANAIQTKVANSIGANRSEQAKADVQTALKIGVGGTLLITGLIAVFGQDIMSIYTGDAQIIQLVVGLLWINVVVEVGRSMNLILGGVLRASGEAVFLAIMGVSCMWLIGVGLSYVFVFGAGLGIAAVWLAMAIDENVRGIAELRRWRQGKWEAAMVTLSDKPDKKPVVGVVDSGSAA